MATAISSSIIADEDRLKIFSLIWLDAELHKNKQTEQRLRSTINYFKKFQDVQQCQEYIEQTKQKDRLVLIVSGHLGREIVPSIHQLRQVVAIYVYCLDKTENEQWSSKFSKVKDVVTNLDQLANRITDDHQIQKYTEETLPINIFSINSQEFLFSQILIDCLLTLQPNEDDHKEFIEFCQHEYRNNVSESNYLREFKEEYSSKKALWWYTRKSFFSKILNATFYNRNLYLILLCHSFISDLQRQLRKHQSKTMLKVYRSQILSKNELEIFKQSIGQFISINTFFSTTTNYSQAISFLSGTTDDLNRVLFEIEANPDVVTTKPFAEINVDEILFMIGSIFRLKNISYNENDQIWIIQIALCSDDENELKEGLMDMKNQFNNDDYSLRRLGKILRQMGKFNLAEKYFKRLLRQLSATDPLICDLYEDLSELALLRGGYKTSVSWHEKACGLTEQKQLSSRSNKEKNKKCAGKNISSNQIQWKQSATIVAGGNRKGNQLNQLYYPEGIFVDDDQQCIYIADSWNHRIVQWKFGEAYGQVVAGGNDKGKLMNQLDCPRDVIVDKKNNSLIICDRGNRRVVRWACENGQKGETIISNIDCYSVTMDKNGDLYVSDVKNNEVRRWKIGEPDGILVAGGNGRGNHLDQLNGPTFLFVDENYFIYVSDCGNARVMKWMEGAKEGIIVAGGQGRGNSLRQLSYPLGLYVNDVGDVYVADSSNYRVMCWSSDSKVGRVVVQLQSHLFVGLGGLSFDRENNLYVADYWDNQIQKHNVA